LAFNGRKFVSFLFSDSLICFEEDGFHGSVEVVGGDGVDVGGETLFDGGEFCGNVSSGGSFGLK